NRTPVRRSASWHRYPVRGIRRNRSSRVPACVVSVGWLSMAHHALPQIGVGLNELSASDQVKRVQGLVNVAASPLHGTRFDAVEPEPARFIQAPRSNIVGQDSKDQGANAHPKRLLN